ncbi:MAG: NADH-quinone oxidoreductase subunit C [Deltaproteobacteria bacterium]|nr:NADH-quinone oxidoreductase subunit C [Deltaproteobacteria bacterium]
MTFDAIADDLKVKFKNDILEIKSKAPDSHSDPFIVVTATKIYDILKYLHSSQHLYFDNLLCVSGVDWKDHFEVVYHVHSYRHLHKIILKVKLSDREHPEIPSMCDLWKGANWLEREVFDMFGISFRNHPDLKRILLPEDWEGYPLRKDYKTQETWHGIKVGM